jgi:hypothetical protein
MMRAAHPVREPRAGNDSAGTGPALHAMRCLAGDYLTLTSVTSNTTATFGGKPVRGSAP